ncbi:hypothetical protein CROQUDRAFT_659500 [Cronartium quercuum f. sp. fusiforme G11]|uniref:GH18 domain-containing protein n=1 Tax=Cronartium quercuum f. sp. fusiforme G11 TaxID=708437 RepID=A0A9P6NIM5_9BASI|nr:hypothetical protein CROQUDRAFT_659500 [Cronartium quercuum f. sp. fusiforme G11]
MGFLNSLHGPPPPVPTHSRPGSKPPLPPRTQVERPSPHYQAPQPVLAGYYASWTVYSKPPFPPSHAAYYHLNTILYAFAKITSKGEVTLGDQWGDIEKPFEPSLGIPEFDPGFKGNLGEIAIMKHRNPKLRSQLSIGGASDETTRMFQVIIKCHDAMRRFASDCAGLCRKYGFDGIDVDYEHPETAAEGRGLLELLKHLRASLDNLGQQTQRPERFLLTVATNWSATHLPLAEMNQVLDRIYLMTYDASGSWDKTLNHHAPLHGPSHAESVNKTVQLYHSRGIPLHKLILGAPLYSRSFITRHGVCGQNYERVCGPSEDASGEGTHMYNALPRTGATEYHDPQLGVSYSFDGKEWCSYDTPTSIQWKTAFVKERGLGGVFFWDLAGGHVAQKPPHPRDLVAVTWEGLFGGVLGSY